MSRYLDPKADIVFKKIFGEHPHLLMSFLNAVLPLPPERPIVELSYLPNELLPDMPVLKKTIADVRCIDKEGHSFIVEMQIDWTESFKQRLLFETSQAFARRLKKGQGYDLLQPVYGLGLVAASFDESPCWYHHYQLVNIGKEERDIIEQMQLVFIELPKFPISSPEHKKLRLLWLRFMREIDNQTTQVAEDLLMVPEIAEALQLAEESAYTESELRAYESYWDAVSTEKTLFNERYRDGKAEGRIEGKKEGRAEERFAIARLMKSQGIDTATIITCTRLSEIEIQSL